MFGATTKVDMVSTRKNDFGRFEVAVLNPSLIPTQMDVVIGTRWFELKFVVEEQVQRVPSNTSSGKNSCC